jgi:steroid 5-alpha reductase family enzyme
VLTVLLANLVAVAVLITATALLAKARGRVVYVDIAWGSGFVLVALVSALVGSAPIRWVLLVMVALWGLRLARHVGKRVLATDEEDPRYAEMLDGKPFSFAVKRVFLTQGIAMYLVSLPVQVAAALGDGVVLWLAVVGVVVWVVGLVFETVGDAQLSAYRAQPRDSRPQVMDQGLWRYTRHPNYFGDSAVWWGIWVTAVAGTLWALITVFSPAVMTYFLVFATGARLLERDMMKRPGYPEYAERTSMFFPLPPKKRPASA